MHKHATAGNANDSGRTALVFRGLSYAKKYKHQVGFSYTVDFRKVMRNHQANLPLATSDVYFSTNDHDLADELIRAYTPAAWHFEKKAETIGNPYLAVCLHSRKALALIKASGKIYDRIIICRFDALLAKPLHTLPIDKNKFNFLCYCENDNLIDDNLWIFPGTMADEIDRVLARVQAGEIARTHDMITSMNRSSTTPLFAGHYFIVKERPYITFLRETSPLSALHRWFITHALSGRMLWGRWLDYRFLCRDLPRGIARRLRAYLRSFLAEKNDPVP